MRLFVKQIKSRMIKTSTKTKRSAQQPELQTNEMQREAFFYESIRPKLDQLKKNPSNETIEAILNYSKKH